MRAGKCWTGLQGRSNAAAYLQKEMGSPRNLRVLRYPRNERGLYTVNSIRYINIALEIFGAVLSLVIISCLALSEYEKNALNRKFIRVLACNILLQLSDAAAWALKGCQDPIGGFAVRAANFGVFTFGYILIAVFTDYLMAYLGTKAHLSRTLSLAVGVLCAIAVGLTVLSQFNQMYYSIDENNLYHRENWFWLSQFWGIACMGINGSLILRYRRLLQAKEYLPLLSYIVLPVAAMCIQIFVYGIALTYIAISVSILSIYMGIQVAQSKEFKQKELELAESRISVMLSQMTPHFLFNSLNAISALCMTDPKKADEAILQFADYLRGNVEALESNALIRFEVELKHIQSYAAIEQLRYGELLSIEYDIAYSDFMVSTLSIQPIVENAIKHGVGKKDTGGTVTLSTRLQDGWAVIIISDDGVGFDPRLAQKPGSIGLKNVQKRLQYLCNAQIDVESEPGRGSMVTIRIPPGGARRLPS